MNEQNTTISVGAELYLELLDDLWDGCKEMVQNGELTPEEAIVRYDMKKDELLDSIPDEAFCQY